MAFPASTQMQKKKRRMATGNWSQLFPGVLDTLQASSKFARKLVAIAISQIVYLRSGFTEDAYAETDLDGLKLKMLNGNDRYIVQI
jgi:hypothetical protein